MDKKRQREMTMNLTKNIMTEDEKMRKITLGEYRVYGQMEEIAGGEKDIEEYVFKGGSVIPANQDAGKMEPVFDIIPEGVFVGKAEPAPGTAPEGMSAGGMFRNTYEKKF